MNTQNHIPAYFSGNNVASGDGTMARRKGVLTVRVVLTVFLVLVVGALMLGRIFLSNQITGLRSRVADLENQKEFLEAGNANLLSRWNLASKDETIVKRAEKELGLIVPEDPGPVLVCVREDRQSRSGWKQRWTSWLDQDRTSQVMAGAMVSLVPRAAVADAPDPGGD